METILKNRITEKVDIEKYQFTWLNDENKGIDGLISLAKCQLSNYLSIILCYKTKEDAFYIYFDKPLFQFEAELSDDFFKYIHNTYVAPAFKLGIGLSKAEFSKHENEYIEKLNAHFMKFEDPNETEQYVIFLGEENWHNLMSYFENNMIFNSMLAQHVSIMHMATVRGGDFSTCCTQATASQFMIHAPFSADAKTPFNLLVNYFPDNSKYNPVSKLLKQITHYAGIPSEMPNNIPTNMPLDVLGAIYYAFGNTQ